MGDAAQALTHIGLPRFETPGLVQLVFFLVPLLLVESYEYATSQLEFIADKSWFIKLNIVLFLLFSIVFLAAEKSHQFIYFDF